MCTGWWVGGGVEGAFRGRCLTRDGKRRESLPSLSLKVEEVLVSNTQQEKELCAKGCPSGTVAQRAQKSRTGALNTDQPLLPFHLLSCPGFPLAPTKRRSRTGQPNNPCHGPGAEQRINLQGMWRETGPHVHNSLSWGKGKLLGFLATFSR